MNIHKTLSSAFALLFFGIIVLSGCVNDKVFPPDVDPMDTTDTMDTTMDTTTQTNPCDSITVSYSADIEPIITTECAYSVSCHGSGSVNGPFTSYLGVKQKVDNGSFEQEVIVQKTMPQGDQLTSTQLELIECWLEDGAPDN